MATITILFILESGRYKIALLVLASEKLGQQNILLNLAKLSQPFEQVRIDPSPLFDFGAKIVFGWIGDLEVLGTGLRGGGGDSGLGERDGELLRWF